MSRVLEGAFPGAPRRLQMVAIRPSDLPDHRLPGPLINQNMSTEIIVELTLPNTVDSEDDLSLLSGLIISSLVQEQTTLTLRQCHLHPPMHFLQTLSCPVPSILKFDGPLSVVADYNTEKKAGSPERLVCRGTMKWDGADAKVILKCIIHSCPLEMLSMSTEAALYCKNLTDLQGKLVPIYYGLYTAELNMPEVPGQAGQVSMSCIILEDLGEPYADSHGWRTTSLESRMRVMRSWRELHKRGVCFYDNPRHLVTNFQRIEDLANRKVFIEEDQVRISGFESAWDDHECQFTFEFQEANYTKEDFLANPPIPFLSQCEELVRVFSCIYLYMYHTEVKPYDTNEDDEDDDGDEDEFSDAARQALGGL